MAKGLLNMPMYILKNGGIKNIFREKICRQETVKVNDQLIKSFQI